MKSYIRKSFQRIGVDIRRITSSNHDVGQISLLLKHHMINTVLDVGANTGQFAKSILHAGFEGSVISFEPLQSAYVELRKEAQNFKNWTIYDRCALGNKNTSGHINVSNNSVSSSLRGISNTHIRASETSAFVSREQIEIARLDTLWGGISTKNSGPYYLKIDTQGYEKEVILGSGNVLDKISLLQSEVSMVELYDNQILWLEFMDWLKTLGFVPIAIQKGFTDPHSGHGLQMDVIFQRN